MITKLQVTKLLVIDTLQNYIIMCLIMSSMWAFVAVSIYIYINIFLNMIHFTTFGMHKISL